MAVRFNKTLVIEACRSTADAICGAEKFHDRSGWAQVLPDGHDKRHPAVQARENELARKAVEYGRAMAYAEMARWIEDDRYKDQVQ